MKQHLQLLSIVIFLVFLLTWPIELILGQTTKSNKSKAEEYYEKANQLNKDYQLDSAATYYYKSYQFYYKNNKPSEAANSLNKAITTLSRLRSYDLNIEYILEFQEKMAPKLSENHVELIENHFEYGIAYLSLNKIDSAIIQLEKALSMAKTNKEYKATCDIYSQLANTSVANYDYDKAENYYKKSIQLKYESKNKDDSIAVNVDFANMGVFYGFYLNDYEKALVYLKRAVQGYLKYYGEKSPALPGIYANIGAMHEYKGEPDFAIEYSEKARDLFIEKYGAKNYMLANLYNTIGNAYLDKKDYKQSIKNYLVSINMYASQKNKNLVYLGNAYVNLGKIYLLDGNIKEAKKYSEKALKLVKNDKKLKNISYHLKAEINVEQGDFEQAIQNSDKSINTLLVKINGKDWNISYQNLLKGYAYRVLIHEKIYDQNNDIKELKKARKFVDTYVELLEEYMQETTELESKRFFREQSFIAFDKGLDINAKLFNKSGDSTYLYSSFNLIEKYKSGVLRHELKDAQVKSASNIPDALIKRDQNYKREVADLLSKIQNEKDSLTFTQYEKELNDLQISKNIFVDSLHKSYPIYYQLKYDNGTISLNELQNTLKKGELLLEYFEGEKSLFVFGATSNQVLFEDIALDSLLKVDIAYLNDAFRNKEQELSSSDFYIKYTDKSFSVYQKVLSPVLKQIGNTGITKIYLNPDGKLSYLPFEILLSNKSNSAIGDYKNLDYLLKEFAVSYGYSASLLFNENKDIQKDKFSAGSLVSFGPQYPDNLAENNELIADIKFRNALIPLDWNQEEAKILAGKMNGTYYTGLEATEANFKQKANGHQVLHLSMHALIDDKRPMYSKLAFTREDSTSEDGFLHTFELYSMKLNNELVVLSACNTGYGKLRKGEGIMSLARAFSYAGVPSVVTSQWQIDDKSSYEFMDLFYDQLSNDLTKDRAMRQAKLDFIEKAKGGNANPFYWGAYILIGDNQPLNKISNHQYVFWVLSGILIVALIYSGKKRLSSK